jgi:hypothetical protein
LTLETEFEIWDLDSGNWTKNHIDSRNNIISSVNPITTLCVCVRERERGSGGERERERGERERERDREREK